ncbi:MULTISPECIES: TetR/AcrR family transcriptional regulator [unclassified Curtobacterium]|uniref:TetR/AcrR family transcriptional regulator n=1 Tax=unclassified Curtobacterium TaxID=257496 RepID=UPI00382A6D47
MPAVLSDVECHRRLMAAADDLFNRAGTTTVELADVARRAGVPAGRAASVVVSKDALVEAVLHQQHDRWTGNLLRAVDPIEDPRDALIGIFTFLEHWFAEDDFAGCVFINAYGELGRTNPRILDMVRDHTRVFTGIVDDLVARAGLPAMLTASIVLLAEGAQVAAATMGSVAPAREARTSAAMLIGLYGPQ